MSQPPQWGVPQPSMPPPVQPPPGVNTTAIIIAAIVVAGGVMAAAIFAFRPAPPGVAVAAPAATAPVPLAMRPLPPSLAPRAPSVPEPADPDPPEAPVVNAADRDTARRIAAMDVANRDAALCAVEAQSDATITFGLLDRDPRRFDASLWTFRGRAIQVEDLPDLNATFILVSLDSYASQIVAVGTYVRPPDNVVADRRVRVYGRIAGTYTYTTRNGQERTVPRVLAVGVLHQDDAPRCRR